MPSGPSIIYLTHLFHTVSKGISSHLMKATAKRRRSKKQIQEDKEHAEWEKAETVRKMQKLAQLEAENASLKNELQHVEQVK